MNNPDWVPTKNLGYEDVLEQRNGEFDKESSEESNDELNDELNRHLTSTSQLSVKESEIKIDISKASKETQTNLSKKSIGTQTDATFTGMTSEIILSYQSKIRLLEQMLSIRNVKVRKSKGKDKRRRKYRNLLPKKGTRQQN